MRLPTIPTIVNLFGEHQEIPGGTISFDAFKLQLSCRLVRFHHISVRHKGQSIFLGEDLCLDEAVLTPGERSAGEFSVKVNADVMKLILDAYNELLAENQIKEKTNKLNFKKFIVAGRTRENTSKKQEQHKRETGLSVYEQKSTQLKEHRDFLTAENSPQYSSTTFRYIESPIEEKNVDYLTKKQFKDAIKLGVNKFQNIDILDQLFPFSSLALHYGERAKNTRGGILKIPDNTKLTETEWAMLQSQPISLHFGENITVESATSSNTTRGMQNYSFEYAYKTQSVDKFSNIQKIMGEVDLSTIQKTTCRGFDIQNTTFTDSVNLCNAVFDKSETKDATFEKGIIFNHNTDFSKWSGHVKMPNNAEIVYINEQGKKIRTTVDELYKKLVDQYKQSRTGFFSWFRSDFIADTLEKDTSLTTGGKLFKLLQHMQEQKNKWFSRWRSHRTLDVFNNVITALPESIAATEPSTQDTSKQSSTLSDTKQSGNDESQEASHNTSLRVSTSNSTTTSPLPERAESTTENGPEEIENTSFIPQRSSTPEIYREDILVRYIKSSRFESAKNYIIKHKLSELTPNIENAILFLKQEAYKDACFERKTENLKKFLQSDFAKQSLIQKYLQKTKISNFEKTSRLSIKLTSCIMQLLAADKKVDFSELANLSYLANNANVKNLTELYWTNSLSCDEIKLTLKQKNKNIEPPLASIIPNGRFDQDSSSYRLIRTENIPGYLIEALGLSGHIKNIVEKANNILNSPEFNWARDDNEEINPQKIKETKTGILLGQRKENKEIASHLSTLQTLIKTFATGFDPAVNINQTLIELQVIKEEINGRHLKLDNAIDNLIKTIKEAYMECRENIECFSKELESIKAKAAAKRTASPHSSALFTKTASSAATAAAGGGYQKNNASSQNRR